MGPALLKLVLTPTLITTATLLQRRWGHLLGGRLVGLPLTSASSLILLTLRDGPSFAVQAATATLSGQLAVAAFCLGYARVATTHRWPIALAVGVCCYAFAALALSLYGFSLPALEVLVPTGLAAALSCWPAITPRHDVTPTPAWELPARIVVATGLTSVVLTSAAAIGARASGMVAPFPAFASLSAALAHRRAGGPLAIISLRSVVTAALSSSVFFLTVALALPDLGATRAFLLSQVVTVFTHLLVNVFSNGLKAGDSCIGRMIEPNLASSA